MGLFSRLAEENRGYVSPSKPCAAPHRTQCWTTQFSGLRDGRRGSCPTLDHKAHSLLEAREGEMLGGNCSAKPRGAPGPKSLDRRRRCATGGRPGLISLTILLLGRCRITKRKQAFCFLRGNKHFVNPSFQYGENPTMKCIEAGAISCSFFNLWTLLAQCLALW